MENAMRFLRKALLLLPGLAALYGLFLFVEHMTTQELTRASDPATQETVLLMWKPRLLRGHGECFLELLNAREKVTDRISLGTLNAGFDALQEFGQLHLQDGTLTVSGRRDSSTSRRFNVRDGRLTPAP